MQNISVDRSRVSNPKSASKRRTERHSPLRDLFFLAMRLLGARSLCKPLPNFARVGPIHFQPLEWELAPVREFLRGNLLNAGAGNRSIQWLTGSSDIVTIVNYDIASHLPGVVLGSLDQMPFDGQTFDSILCNAVLEHVESAHAVLRELIRVLRSGGYLVLSVPFLQPFHPCPTDFRRYTEAGMRQIALDYGLEIVQIFPVHNISQTVGWIFWEYLCETERRFSQLLAYPILWGWTRYTCTTDAKLNRSANTFQVVLRKSVPQFTKQAGPLKGTIHVPS
jgi:SAM-dependent methyltransferase